MARALLLAWLAAVAVGPAAASEVTAVFATRTLRVGALVTPQDVALRALPERRAAGVATRLEEVVGREVRRNLYAERPISPDDLGAPTLVHRNSLITLVYHRGNIQLTTVGRALDSAGLQETVRVVNVDSRATVLGTVLAPGVVGVGGRVAPAGHRP